MALRTRRRRGFSRRPKRKMAWNAAANSACIERLTVTHCDDESFDLIDPDYFNLVNNPPPPVPGDVSAGTEVTVLRLVGDLTLWSSINATAATEPQLVTTIFYMGIFIADLPAEGGSRYDPTRSDDASAGDWLWRGMVVHNFHSTGGQIAQTQIANASSPGAWPHIDIRVKRKLRPNEAILLAVKVAKDNPFPSGTDRTDLTAGLYASMRYLVALP